MQKLFNVDPKKISPARDASMFTAFLFYGSDQDKGDQKHSNKNEVSVYYERIGGDLKYRVNQANAYRGLIRMIENSDRKRAGASPLKHGWWTRAIIYENIYYKEIFNAIPGHHIYLAEPQFTKTEKGAQILEAYKVRYGTDYKLESVPVELVKHKAAANWNYFKQHFKDRIEEKLTIEDADVLTEQPTSRTASVYSNVEQLRNEKLFQGMSSQQLSAVADYLLKQKGRAA